MRKQNILGLIAVKVTAFTFNLAKAQTESSESQNTFGCPESGEMVCGKIKQPDGTYITVNGKCKCKFFNTLFNI